MKPELSIVMPVYNSEKYLSECLDSILGQDFERFEIICVDDASDDGSAEILECCSNSDGRIKVLHQAHGGPGVARNTGLQEVQGKYIYFMDSDDYLLSKDALSFMVNTMEDDGLDILYFGTELLFENEEMRQLRSMEIPWFHRKKEYGLYERGQELFTDFVNNLDFVCNVWIQCVRKSFLEEASIEYPALRECEDEVYTVQTMLSAGRVRHVDRTMYMRRVHPGSIMTDTFRFENFYDGTISWWKMLGFLQERDFPIPVEDAILTHLVRRHQEVRRQYDDLPRDEQERLASLPPVERSSVEMFLNLAPCFQKMGSSFLFPYHLFRPGEKVVLYGAGSVGREFYAQNARTGYVKITGLVDRNAAKMKGGLTVHSVQELPRLDYDSILIAVRVRAVAEEIRDTICSLGIDKSRIKWDGDAYLVQDFYENFYFKQLEKMGNSFREERKGL